MFALEIAVDSWLHQHELLFGRYLLRFYRYDGVNSILSIAIPIPLNSIWSIPIPHKTDQFQFNSNSKFIKFGSVPQSIANMALVSLFNQCQNLVYFLNHIKLDTI